MHSCSRSNVHQSNWEQHQRWILSGRPVHKTQRQGLLLWWLCLSVLHFQTPGLSFHEFFAQTWNLAVLGGWSPILRSMERETLDWERMYPVVFAHALRALWFMQSWICGHMYSCGFAGRKWLHWTYKPSWAVSKGREQLFCVINQDI